MLHPQRVMLTTYYGLRRRLRMALRLPARRRPPPVLSQAVEAVVERHGMIARAAMANKPAGLDLCGKNVCEVGSGDCLAAIALFLGLGARHVDVFEIADPVTNDKQVEVLKRLRAQGLPIDVGVIRADTMTLDTERVTFHKGYMEDFKGPAVVDFMFSFSVMEHVEDLDGFYRASHRIMTPGAQMLHMVDLGGHEVFEDPLPPLDFQTYSEWLYNLMYLKYHRATRRFLDEHKAAVERNGFKILNLTPTRTASEEYLSEIWPKLRPEAHARPRADVGVIEFALTARKQG
ncbi:MAG TPA: class I SAM-dependent methyltransferase [Verrucomicrobiae bacterium]|nr:class I SAM-dependent methyltransferase [Verrucomicrobiae bacterium]